MMQVEATAGAVSQSRVAVTGVRLGQAANVHILSVLAKRGFLVSSGFHSVKALFGQFHIGNQSRDRFSELRKMLDSRLPSSLGGFIDTGSSMLCAILAGSETTPRLSPQAQRLVGLSLHCQICLR